MTPLDSGQIHSLPTLSPGISHRRRGDDVASVIQLLDIRGGPTEPFGIRALGVTLPEDLSRPLLLDMADGEARRDVTAKVDPRTGEPIDPLEHPWTCTVDDEATSIIEAVRRYDRAHVGVNGRASFEERGWSPGLLLSRQQVLPLDPPHLVWLDGELWSVDEVFCVTPTCGCQDLRVEFTPVHADGRRGDSLAVTIDHTRWVLTEAPERGPARALVRRWMEQRGARARVRDLYDRAQAFGAVLHDPFVVRRGVVNSDGRCPCGSRKKFRRCCGKARPAPVPGDLHALEARAQAELRAFAASELGEPVSLGLADELSRGGLVPSEAARWAWLLYWRRYDGFTLADRFLADPERGDLWLRRWLEAASGTPPDVFEVGATDPRTVTLQAMADLDAPDFTVLRSRSGGLRAGDTVLGAPVRLMGRSVLLGAWRLPGGAVIGQSLVHALSGVQDEVARVRWPERVFQAVATVLAPTGER